MPPPPSPPPPKKGSGSLVSSKKRILNSRNNSSAPNFQPMNSPAILNRVSTSNSQDIRPYWNGQVAKWSQKLWLPTDSAASPLTLSSIYSSSILQNSWFSSMMRPQIRTFQGYPFNKHCLLPNARKKSCFTSTRTSKQAKRARRRSQCNKNMHQATTFKRNFQSHTRYPNYSQKQLL